MKLHINHHKFILLNALYLVDMIRNNRFKWYTHTRIYRLSVAKFILWNMTSMLLFLWLNLLPGNSVNMNQSITISGKKFN